VWPLEISKHYYLYLETIVAARPNHRLGTWVDLMSEVSGIRQIPCYLPGELDGTSLVDKMLAIQKGYAMKDNRPATSDDWFRHLKCLSEHPRKKKVLQLAERDPEHLNPQDYIAVSYSFEPAHKSLDKHTLGFEIHNPEGMIKKFKTRDLVLQRVLRYAKKRTRYFWIDQECFDQDDPEEHQAAMDSMDLVYKNSRYPVALLEITFGSNDVCLMDLLMSEVHVWPNKANSMVKMLRRVQKDRWWDRAWTFQEEYVAGGNLELLIRHNLGRNRSRTIRSTHSGIEGEVCVRAIDFKERSTVFLVDLIDRNTTSEELRKTCESLLHTFRRYNVIAETTESAMGKAMSSSVLEDLECRGISRHYDFLPIASNVCDYDNRLCSYKLEKSLSHSVGLCALTMYLMNGEIFHNNDTIAIPTAGMSFSKYLDTTSFNKFRPPAVLYQLSWLKRCRLRPVELSREGAITSGYLWRVHEEIETRKWNWKRVPGVGSCSESSRLNTYQQNTLKRLANELRLRSYETLRKKLVAYLDDDSKRYPSQARAYMNIMAKEVVEAIGSGKKLYLAGLADSSHAYAIFVLDPRDTRPSVGIGAGLDAPNSSTNSDTLVGSRVFTSCSEFHHVSMTVELAQTASEQNSPLMTITGWTNGLAFYDGVSQRRDLVVRWPESWREVQTSGTRKRKR
jgi:hypothetical protein